MNSKTDDLLLNRYEIISKLGSGGFSDVYKAFDTRMEREVAIKRIRLQRNSAERVLREARTVALLNHPNIVTMHEFEEDGDACYLIMELIEGVPLSEVIAQEAPLAQHETIAIAIEICRALEAAHANGIVHRDIKPDNVMILYDGRLKVMDFGIARIKGASTATSGDIIGTFAYMSPEQTRGELVDERSDIFSLGTVLYEMLTKRAPFSGGTVPETLHCVQTVEPPPPSTFNQAVSPELDACVMTALAKDIYSRYPKAADLREHLEYIRTSITPADVILAGLADRCAYAEDEDQIDLDDIETWRTRLWHGISERSTVIARTSVAAALAYPFLPILHEWFGIPTGVAGFAATIIFLAVLLHPEYGIGISFLMLALATLRQSFGLSIILALTLGPYWYVISRRWPLISVAPVGGVACGLLKLPFVFPILSGLLARPLAAAAGAGLGCLLFELTTIFLPHSAMPELIKSYGVWEAIRGDFNPVHVASLIIAPFIKYPLLLLQPFLWAAVGWFTSIVRGSRRWASATIAGFVALVMGYQSLLSKFGSSQFDTGALMQALSFSLIILLLLLIFRPPAWEADVEPEIVDEYADESTSEVVS
ncbi:MAG TPA: serine/threonine-protein kinase [Candidatus Aquicultor sp.]|jgi:tRNA A-37 threonylcarbamoyl transferase component Bud32